MATESTFIHIETYGRIPSRTGKKQSISGVVKEAEREKEACPHVRSIMKPVLFHGVMPSKVAEIAKERASIATDSRKRKLRKDAQIMLAGVASFPMSFDELKQNKDNEEDFKFWVNKNHQFLLKKYGNAYKSLVCHLDETYLHLHFYVIPEIDKSGRLNIGSIHDGILARDSCESTKAKDKMRAYKEAMVSFQDDYYNSVGIPCGLSRTGPRRRRLTRKQWKSEVNIAKNLAQALKSIDKINKQRQELESSKTDFENKKKQAETLAERAINLVQKVKKQKIELINLESKKDSVVEYLKRKVYSLNKKTKHLLEKVSFLESKNKILQNQVSSLSTKNKELERINIELYRQNNIRKNGIQKLKTEMFTILTHAKAGNFQAIENKYNERGSNYE